jgi:hypothetical protein
MSMHPRILRPLVLLALAPLAALAQQSPPATPKAVPPPEQLEPGVNTSAPAPAESPSVSQSTDSAPQPAAAPATKSTPGSAASRKDAAAAKAAPPKKSGPDRLQLDATDITGNRELPKVLYIVPWKRSDLGDLVGKPPNSLLDDVLQPVDRDVFKRENRYYDALKPDPESTPAAPTEGASKNP